MYQATQIMTPEEIDKYCREIQPVIEAEYNADNPAAVMDRANTLEGYMALSGKMVADSNYRYREMMDSIFIESVRKMSGMAPSILSKYLDNLCRDLRYLVDWTDRINRATVHELEFARTVISKLKEEMRIAQSANFH